MVERRRERGLESQFFFLSGATADISQSCLFWLLNELQWHGMISPSLQGLVSFGSNGIREAKKLQVYQYRYQGKIEATWPPTNEVNLYKEVISGRDGNQLWKNEAKMKKGCMNSIVTKWCMCPKSVQLMITLPVLALIIRKSRALKFCTNLCGMQRILILQHWVCIRNLGTPTS